MNNLDIKNITLNLNNAIKAQQIATLSLVKIVKLLNERNSIVDERLRRQDVIKYFPKTNRHHLKLVAHDTKNI